MGIEQTPSTHFNAFPHKWGGFNPSSFAFNIFSHKREVQPLPICFQHERGGFNPSPFIFDAFSCEWGGFNPSSFIFNTFPHKLESSLFIFNMFPHKQGGFNPSIRKQ